MKVQDLDGKWHVLTLDNVVLGDDDRKRSSLHLLARRLLTRVFPCRRFHEEVYIPGMSQYFDFFIPTLFLAVEVHGEEHYRFIQFFHKDIFGFIALQKRDKLKRSWCELNNIKLVELPYNKQEEWECLLKI